MVSRRRQWRVATAGCAAGATIGRTWRLLSALILELADERPYHRYLATHGCDASPEAWRHFQDQRGRIKYQTPRCC